MQQKVLKLKEIIWEVTGACHNRCAYCGSKEVWEDEIDNANILNILDRIAEYPPEEINISGGDPLLVRYDTHLNIVQTLKGLGVKCKIIINPRSIDETNFQENINTINLYDVVGISVNSKEDLLSRGLELVLEGISKPFAIITNFHADNLFSYDRIENLVKSKDCTWIVQYTIFREDDENGALYLDRNEDAFSFLKEKISGSIIDGCKILISDNASDCPCGAGRVSCGILSTGHVVGCLSMRSWKDLPVPVPAGTSGIWGERDRFPEGHILHDSLKNIWINSFNKFRFSDFECCKDHCHSKILLTQDEIVQLECQKENNKDSSKGWRGKNNPLPLLDIPVFPDLDYHTVVMYAVSIKETYVYGTREWQSKKPSKGKYVYGTQLWDSSHDSGDEGTIS